MEGPAVELPRDLNNFGLGDKIGTSLAAITNFKIFKISAAHRSSSTPRLARRGRHDVLTLGDYSLIPVKMAMSPSGPLAEVDEIPQLVGPGRSDLASRRPC